MKLLMMPDLKQEYVDSLMCAMNAELIENIHDYKVFFDEIKNTEAIVLFHCSQDKDRTDLASALLLHILGYDQELIMQDYLTSNTAIDKIDMQR